MHFRKARLPENDPAPSQACQAAATADRRFESLGTVVTPDEVGSKPELFAV